MVSLHDVSLGTPLKLMDVSTTKNLSIMESNSPTRIFKRSNSLLNKKKSNISIKNKTIHVSKCIFFILLFITEIWKLEKKSLKKSFKKSWKKSWKKKLKMERLNFENLGFGEKLFWLFFCSHSTGTLLKLTWVYLYIGIWNSTTSKYLLATVLSKLWKKCRNETFFLEILDKKVLWIRSRLNSFCLLPLWKYFLAVYRLGNDLWFLLLDFFCVY